MSAFLKIDECRQCHRSLPWDWVAAILLGGKPLPGTGVWRTQLIDSLCPDCIAAAEVQRQEKRDALRLRASLTELLGGEKPYREFALDRYIVAPGNQRAYERAERFNPVTENLYLWGGCGVGKTHLAYAAARRAFEKTLSVAILPAWTMSRKARLKGPDQEQSIIDEWTRTDVLVLDDLGAGPDTAYSRQILQEILDRRDFHDRFGLVVTSSYSLDGLAQKLGHDAISSRLAGMCAVVTIQDVDHRLRRPIVSKTE